MAQWPLVGQGFLFIETSRTHSDTHTHTPGRTPLDEWSSRRRDLYLTTHNTNKRHTNIRPAGFEPAIPASERPQTYVLDRAATGIGSLISIRENNHKRTSRVVMNSAYRVRQRMSLDHHMAPSQTPFMDRARKALIRTACVPWRTAIDRRGARLPSYTRCIKHLKPDSKELGMLTLNVEHNYVCFYYKEFTTRHVSALYVGHNQVVVNSL